MRVWCTWYQLLYLLYALHIECMHHVCLVTLLYLFFFVLNTTATTMTISAATSTSTTKKVTAQMMSELVSESRDVPTVVVVVVAPNTEPVTGNVAIEAQGENKQYSEIWTKETLAYHYIASSEPPTPHLTKFCRAILLLLVVKCVTLLGSL